MAEVFVHQIDDDGANRAGLLSGLNKVEVIRKPGTEGTHGDVMVLKTARVQVALLPETRRLLQTCNRMKSQYRHTPDSAFLKRYWNVRGCIQYKAPKLSICTLA
jgi:hypothetical protein